MYETNSVSLLKTKNKVVFTEGKLWLVVLCRNFIFVACVLIERLLIVYWEVLYKFYF